MPFAAMPEQVGVESIFGMSNISEVQIDAVLLLRVTRIAIAYRALGYHRADFLLEALPGFHCSRVESPNAESTFPVPGARSTHHGECSDIEVAHVERVFLDKLATRLDLIAHQLGESFLRLLNRRDLNLEHGTGLGIHGGVPQLSGVHFA
jgi:hypothetical protein